MNFEINKMAGALLGSLLGVMGLGMFSDVLYAPAHMAKPGYDLPAGEAAGAKPAAQAAPAVPLPELLAKADAKKGEALVKPCMACHDFTKADTIKIGPPLHGVVGRAKAHIAGFAYSDAMKAKGGDWSYDELNKFIADPRKDIPGTKMAYAGEKDDGKRADIILYLRSLADSPAPLPK
ncbi:MAG: c-type cytochrome [Rhodoblastus sp.]